MLPRRLPPFVRSAPQGAGVEEPCGMQSRVLLRQVTPPWLTSFQVKHRRIYEQSELISRRDNKKTWENLLGNNLNNSTRSTVGDMRFVIIQ